MKKLKKKYKANLAKKLFLKQREVRTYSQNILNEYEALYGPILVDHNFNIRKFRRNMKQLLTLKAFL